MKILVINAGSSSLKYQLIDMEDESVSAKGLVERIGIEGSKLTHQYGGEKFVQEQPLKDHSEAMKLVLAALTDKEHGVIASIDEIGAVGHRVLHGGAEFTASCIIDDRCIAAIEKCIPLGPLHNPANLMGIRACQAVMPDKPQVAVFDTAFHQTMEPKAYMYGVPYEFYEKYQIRRYGFHGTSHRFVSARAQELLGLGADSKVIRRKGFQRLSAVDQRVGVILFAAVNLCFIDELCVDVFRLTFYRGDSGFDIPDIVEERLAEFDTDKALVDVGCCCNGIVAGKIDIQHAVLID